MKRSFIDRYQYCFLPAVILIAGLGVIILNLTSFSIPVNYIASGKKAFQNKNYAKAIHDFANAEKYCETDIVARYWLGVSYHNYGWNDEALKQYDSVWELFVLDAGQARYNAGRIWLQRGDKEKAVDCYRQALVLLPEADGIWFNLGNLLQQMNRPQSALAAFGEALRLSPNNNLYRQKHNELFKLMNSSERIR